MVEPVVIIFSHKKAKSISRRLKGKYHSLRQESKVTSLSPHNKGVALGFYGRSRVMALGRIAVSRLATCGHSFLSTEAQWRVDRIEEMVHSINLLN